MSVNTSLSDGESFWVDSNGDPVDIPDSYASMSEYVCSVVEVAKFSTMKTRLGFFGHDDVTLKIKGNQGDNSINFIIQINNWKYYAGGRSSKRAVNGYDKNPDCDEPAENMRDNGAFYHKIQTNFPDILGNYNVDNVEFKIESFDNQKVTYVSNLRLE